MLILKILISSFYIALIFTTITGHLYNMYLITYIKAYVFHDFKASCELANKSPSSKNIKLLQKLSGVKNLDVNMTHHVGDMDHLNAVDKVYQTQKCYLNGKTIAPKVASIISDKVGFDSYGEVKSQPYILKSRDFKLLINNMIKPLNETPVKNTEGKIRTTAECVIDMACAVEKSDIQSDKKLYLLNEIKNTYLSGSITKNTLLLLIKNASYTLDTNQLLINKLTSLAESVEKKFYLTKHNDNYYGRTFESIIADMVVSNPSKEMDKNIEIIKNKITTDFNSLHNSEKQDLIESIHDLMVGDPAIWRTDICEVKKFLKECTPDNFIMMMSTPSKLKHLLIMHLAAKYVIRSPGFREMAYTAYALYLDVILPQRNTHTVIKNPEKSNRTGIRLHYQMQGKADQPTYSGVRPIDASILSVDNLTEHNREALAYEKPIAIGMSGTSNLLNHLFIALDDESSDFNIEHARLLAASFLTYSGGHSINEAYTVFGYKDKKSFEPVSYSSFLESDNFTKNIINESYNKLIAEAMTLN